MSTKKSKEVQAPKPEVKPMDREELHKLMQDQVGTLREHANSLQQMIIAMEGVIKGGDVSFIALDHSKECLDTLRDAKLALESARKALKARALVRMKEA